MNVKPYLIVTGILFGLQTVGQFIRVVGQIPIQIVSLNIPVSLSAVGFVITLLLCIWAFRLSVKQ
jgi:hypothetical protein